jgi:hypothetical protein
MDTFDGRLGSIVERKRRELCLHQPGRRNYGAGHCSPKRVIGHARGAILNRVPNARSLGGLVCAVKVSRVPSFRLQFRPKRIDALAQRFSYEDDGRFLTAGAAARARGHYTREEFIEVCRWKTARSASRVAANTQKAVADATGRAFASSDEAQRMTALLELNGVGVPTASALLFFAFPDDYPILDVRALESLGVQSRSQYSVSFWLAYLEACRNLASRHGVHIRALDKALWQYSKERSDRLESR